MATKKILLVEDSEDWIFRMENTLEGHYDLVSARTSDEAFAAMEQSRFDLVLLDIMLKGSTLQGDELIEHLVQKQPDIKTIMISCLSKISVVERCFNSGARWYISKDCDEQEIKKRIAAALIEKPCIAEYYCDLRLIPELELHKAKEDGAEAAAIVDVFRKNVDPVPSFTEETVLDLFFSPPAFLVNGAVSESDIPSFTNDYKNRYAPNRPKTDILLYGLASEPEHVRKALEDQGIRVHIAYKPTEIHRIIFDHDIAGVILMLPPDKALYLLRKIKVIDPRIEVSVFYTSEADLDKSIMLKANGSYRLTDRIFDIPAIVIGMLEKSAANFKDAQGYNKLTMQKIFWCQGFIEKMKQNALLRAQALGKSIKPSDYEKLDHVATVLHCVK